MVEASCPEFVFIPTESSRTDWYRAESCRGVLLRAEFSVRKFEGRIATDQIVQKRIVQGPQCMSEGLNVRYCFILLDVTFSPRVDW